MEICVQKACWEWGSRVKLREKLDCDAVATKVDSIQFVLELKWNFTELVHVEAKGPSFVPVHLTGHWIQAARGGGLWWVILGNAVPFGEGSSWGEIQLWAVSWQHSWHPREWVPLSLRGIWAVSQPVTQAPRLIAGKTIPQTKIKNLYLDLYLPRLNVRFCISTLAMFNDFQLWGWTLKVQKGMRHISHPGVYGRLWGERKADRERELNKYLHVALPTSELYTNASSAIDTIVT